MDTSHEPTDTDLTPEEQEEDRRCIAFAELFNRRHRPKKKRASSKKPTFSIRLQPGQGELT